MRIFAVYAYLRSFYRGLTGPRANERRAKS
jgi:hypothetical protein